MSYLGPYSRYLQRRGVKPPTQSTRNFWLQPWVLIILGAAVFAALGVVEALVVGYLPWGSITRPGLWKLPASMFLVGVFVGFCISAEADGWFGKQRRVIQALVGLGVGLGIALLFSASFMLASAGALVGSVAGYFGDHWSKDV